MSTEHHDSWYNAFVTPTMNQLLQNDSVKMVKLGPINISKTMRSGNVYLGLGDNVDYELT